MSKKVIVILAIIVVAIAGCFIYLSTRKTELTDDEKAKVQIYIEEIYGWSEIYGDALPEFKNINNANEDWIWDRVQQRLHKDIDSDDYLYTYTQIEKAQKHLFGDKLKKEFPIDGTDFLIYDEETGRFLSVGIGLDDEDDCFAISTVTKNGNKYTVEIIEYLVDNGNIHEAFMDDEVKGYEIYLKNLNEEQVKSYWTEFYTEYIDEEEYISTDTKQDEIEKYVLENKDKFNTKIIKLELDKKTNLLHVVSVKKK